MNIRCKLKLHRKEPIGYLWSGDAIYWCTRCKRRVK